MPKAKASTGRTLRLAVGPRSQPPPGVSAYASVQHFVDENVPSASGVQTPLAPDRINNEQEVPTSMSQHAKDAIAIVRVASGDTEVSYNLHISLLQEKSPFFRAAFGPGFQEGATKEMTLPEVELKVFEVFVDWLYKNKLRKNENSSKLIDVWILADRLMCAPLQNQVIERLKARDGGPVQIHYEKILQLQECGLGESELMKFYLDVVAHRFCRSPNDYEVAGNDPVFQRLSMPVVLRIMKQVQVYAFPHKPKPGNSGLLAYHV